MEALNEALLEPTNGARDDDGAVGRRAAPRVGGVGVVAGRCDCHGERGGRRREGGRTLALLGPRAPARRH